MPYLIDVPQKFISDLTYKIDTAGNKLMVCGFYSNDLNKYGYDGCFYQQLDINSKSILVSSIKEFDLNLLTQGLNKKEVERAKQRDNSRKQQYFSDYNLRDIIVRKDGSMVMISECNYTLSISEPDGKGGYGANTTFHYDNLLVVNINTEGIISWISAVPKTSHEQVLHQYTSYASMAKGDKIYLLFNDNIENYSRNIIEDGVMDAEYNGENAVLTIATISNDGSVKREPLFKSINLSVIARPCVSKQINDNELLLIGEYEKVDQFAIIDFK